MFANNGWKNTDRIIGIFALVSMLITLYMIFIWVPVERIMGPVQKIFYFHVGLAWVGFFAFFVVFLCSVSYLITKNYKWDVFAATSAEVGLVFMTLVLITGLLWGRSSWNTWWVWEPRLATSVILWLIYCVYFLIRQLELERLKKLFWVSTIGISGFLTVILVIFSIKILRVNHPMLIQGGKMSIEPAMFKTMMSAVLSFTFIYVYYFSLSLKVAMLKQELLQLKGR